MVDPNVTNRLGGLVDDLGNAARGLAVGLCVYKFDRTLGNAIIDC